MKNSTMQGLEIILAMTLICIPMAAAVPLPTSVFGEISGKENVVVTVLVENDGLALHNKTIEPDGLGRYVLVFTTEGIKKVNVTINVYEDSELLYEESFKDVETGSKLELNIEFEPEEEPVVETKIEKTGGGGGSNEPTLDDIAQKKDPPGTASEPVIQDQPEDPDDKQEDKQKEAAQDEPRLEEPKHRLRLDAIAAIAGRNSLYLLLALTSLLLALLLIIIRMDQKKQYET